MGKAKDIEVKPISSKDANKIIKRLHYSGKVVPNSKIHFGVFLNGECGGALQFGPSMRKDLIAPLVKGTGWNEFIELNRMALADWLPRNGESRAISLSMKLLKKNYPWLKWVVSFADATQCGDGTIYRASNFVLTGIKRNTQLRMDPETGQPIQSMAAFHKGKAREFKNWDKLSGYQLRYIYFLHPKEKENLTVPILPFNKIDQIGAGMYRGEKVTYKERNQAAEAGDGPDQGHSGGSTPTQPLQNNEVNNE